MKRLGHAIVDIWNGDWRDTFISVFLIPVVVLFGYVQQSPVQASKLLRPLWHPWQLYTVLINSYNFGQIFPGTVFFVDSTAGAGGTGAIGSPWDTQHNGLVHANLDTALSAGPVRILCSGATTDPTPCTQTTWDSVTTTAAHYLEVWGDNRTGKRDLTKYHMQPAVNNACEYNNHPGHVWFYYLQGAITASGSTGQPCFRLATNNVGTGASDNNCGHYGCIAVVDGTGTTGHPTGFYDSPWGAGGSGTIVRQNCIVYEVNSTNKCIGFAGENSAIINDSCLSDCGWYDYSDDSAGGTEKCYNTVGVSSPAASSYVTAFAAGSHNNASSDGSASVVRLGTGSLPSQNFATVPTFVNQASHDYHLNSGDTKLKGLGDTNLLYDINGTLRNTPDDIGPNEGALGDDIAKRFMESIDVRKPTREIDFEELDLAA